MLGHKRHNWSMKTKMVIIGATIEWREWRESCAEMEEACWASNPREGSPWRCVFYPSTHVIPQSPSLAYCWLWWPLSLMDIFSLLLTFFPFCFSTQHKILWEQTVHHTSLHPETLLSLVGDRKLVDIWAGGKRIWRLWWAGFEHS